MLISLSWHVDNRRQLDRGRDSIFSSSSEKKSGILQLASSRDLQGLIAWDINLSSSMLFFLIQASFCSKLLARIRPSGFLSRGCRNLSKNIGL